MKNTIDMMAFTMQMLTQINNKGMLHNPFLYFSVQVHSDRHRGQERQPSLLRQEPLRG